MDTSAIEHPAGRRPRIVAAAPATTRSYHGGSAVRGSGQWLPSGSAGQTADLTSTAGALDEDCLRVAHSRLARDRRRRPIAERQRYCSPAAQTHSWHSMPCSPSVSVHPFGARTPHAASRRPRRPLVLRAEGGAIGTRLSFAHLLAPGRRMSSSGLARRVAPNAAVANWAQR